MVVVQKVKEAEITEQNSLLLTRNLLRIAIFNISYIRGLFPEKYFNDKLVPALEMKIKKLMPMDADSRRLIDWMEQGVYDALQKKYLKTLLFCICEEMEGPTIEEYAFSFSYADLNSEEVSMNVNRIGNKKNGATFKSNSMDITPDQMRSSACKMVRTLVQLMRTLGQMPEERTILMKLLYYDDVTPEDYEPPFFRSCNENEAPSKWTKNPLKMEVGNVNSKHFVLALKVKSILDPCEDENDDLSESEVSLSEDDSSSSDSEIRPSLADQFVVAPDGEKCSTEDNSRTSDDETQDAANDEEQTARVKEWINARHINTFDLADVLSDFPEISMAASEDVMERLRKEGLVSKVGKDSYTINKEKERNNMICGVKEEVELQDNPQMEKISKNAGEDYMYMKALYHALPMDYVTVGKLQNKLGGDANPNTVRKLIDKMTHDGYLENSRSKRLGKRVVHSESSNKKLMEVKRVLKGKPREMETDGKPFDFNCQDLPPKEDQNMRDVSTCGGLHSIGSDLTRTRGPSETYQNGSVRSEQPVHSKAQEQDSTPTSNAEPIASLESGVPGKETERDRSRASIRADGSNTTQDKWSRKSSTVKEPILHYVKRQKSKA